MLSSSGSGRSPRLRSVSRSSRFVLLVCGSIASGLLIASGADERSSRNEYVRRSGAHARNLRSGGVRSRDVVVASPCPPVVAGQIYRFIDGIDSCMIPMGAGDLAKELNDPWGALVLRKNAGGAGPWPGSVAEIVEAMAAVSASNQFQQFSYLLGEGSQIPTTIAPRTGNRDLRYVVTWGPSIASPSVFLAPLPPGSRPASRRRSSRSSPSTPPSRSSTITSTSAIRPSRATRARPEPGVGRATPRTRGAPRTVGRGCFACHLNGGLNMKELTPPWNNWQSPQASVNEAVVPPAVAIDPLFLNLSGADKFQQAFQGRSSTWASGSSGMRSRGSRLATRPSCSDA